MKKGNLNKFHFTILFSLGIVLGVGYAFLNNTLHVFGNALFAGNKWDIHFENLVVGEGSVTTSSQVLFDSNKTNVHFTSLLSKPGDYFEFYVDVVNNGNIDAKLNSVICAGLNDSQRRYLNYLVVYSDNGIIKNGDILQFGEMKTVKVRVEFKQDITLDDLPRENDSIQLSFFLNYTQAN